ncbi:hypothetical protein KSS87_015268 [Heliosperma pusillum]|nr:hypothetical protein KSS87_015268 [Heliosperma pusillum]
MQGFTKKIVQMMKSERLFASQGGPIVLSQIENECGSEVKEFGAAGEAYINWAAKMAVGLNTGVPWAMAYVVKGLVSGGRPPHLSFRDNLFEYLFHSLVISDNIFCFGLEYHGGTNFARTAGGPFITTSYDYDAPIDEYGLIRQPKYGHLKQLHRAIKLCERALVSSNPTGYCHFTRELSASLLAAHVFSGKGTCAAFLYNYHFSSSKRVTFRNEQYDLPAWSISILPDCKNVVFNTAKTYDEDLYSLEDSPTMTVNGLLEQVNVTRDSSDYLWYMTSVVVSQSDIHGQDPELLVQSSGHAVHVFLNGQLSGSAYGSREDRRFTFKGPVKLRIGVNRIALLSIAVGLPNVGPRFETWSTGVLGPVILQGLHSGKKDLTWQKWSYEIGLKGERMNLASPTRVSSADWVEISLAAQRTQPLTWYKAYFDAPGGVEPLALDMQSMGKGEIWINGANVGRYWTNYAKGNCGPCSYQGTYRPAKCQHGCGSPTQRWYHVPRTWLKPRQNLMVIFEELGGDASKISLVKRSVARICSDVYEDHPTTDNWTLDGESYNEPVDHVKAHLQCGIGQSVSSIQFASFGTPSGTCGSFLKGTCHAKDSHTILENMCIGKQRCSVSMSNMNFGGNPCPNILKRLSIEAICS